MSQDDSLPRMTVYGRVERHSPLLFTHDRMSAPEAARRRLHSTLYPLDAHQRLLSTDDRIVKAATACALPSLPDTAPPSFRCPFPAAFPRHAGARVPASVLCRGARCDVFTVTWLPCRRESLRSL